MRHYLGLLITDIFVITVYTGKMPARRNNRFAVGHFMSTKKELQASLAEKKAKQLSGIKKNQQQIRRLKIKVRFIMTMLSFIKYCMFDILDSGYHDSCNTELKYVVLFLHL